MDKRVIALLSALAAFSSCVDPISLDPMEEMPLVVNCVLTRPDNQWDIPDDNDVFDYRETSPQYLDLYRAKRPSETGYQIISDARVAVTSGDKRYDFHWNGERWESSFRPRYGGTYLLEVITADNDTLTARTRFPQRLHLTRVPVHVDFGGWWGVNTRASYFCLLNQYSYFETVSVTPNAIYNELRTKTRAYTGNYSMWISAIQDDEPVDAIFTSHPSADAFNITPLSWNGCSLREDFMENFNDVSNRREPDPALLERWDIYDRLMQKSSAHATVLRIHHTGGLPGCLDGTSEMHAPVEYEGFSDDCLFAVAGAFDVTRKHYEDTWDGIDIYSEWYYSSYYKVRFVSEEYDMYLRDVYGKNIVRGDEFASHYSMDKIYTNIKGGKGIFGASIEHNIYF